MSQNGIRISELPQYYGVLNTVAEIPISIAGVTYKINPDQFSTPFGNLQTVTNIGASTTNTVYLNGGILSDMKYGSLQISDYPGLSYSTFTFASGDESSDQFGTVVVNISPENKINFSSYREDSQSHLVVNSAQITMSSSDDGGITGNLFTINATNSTSTDIIKYQSDLSDDYDERTLVDKEYVDRAIEEAGSGDLQTVTDTGATTSNTIAVGGLNLYNSANDEYGTLNYDDTSINLQTPLFGSIFTIGDGLSIRKSGGVYFNLSLDGLTDDRNYFLQNKSGTFSMLSDITGTLNYHTKFSSTGLTQSILSDNGSVLVLGVTPSVGITTNQILVRDTSGNIKYVNGASYSVSGATNSIPKFGTSTSLTQSRYSDNGTYGLYGDTTNNVNFLPGTVSFIAGTPVNYGTGLFKPSNKTVVIGDTILISGPGVRGGGGGSTATMSYNGTSTGNIIKIGVTGSYISSAPIGSSYSITNDIINPFQVLSNGQSIHFCDGSYPSFNTKGMYRLNSDLTIDNTFLGATSGFMIGISGGRADAKDSVLYNDGINEYMFIATDKASSYNGTSSTSNNLLGINTTNGDRVLGSMSVIQSIYTMDKDINNKLVIGGTLGKVNGVTQSYLARLDIANGGIFDTSLVQGSGFDGDIYRLKCDNSGNILCYGGFSSYKGVSISIPFVRISATGSLDTSFNVVDNRFLGDQLGNGGGMLIDTDNKIYSFGAFTIDGISWIYLVRLNTDGTIDSTFNIGTGFNSVVTNVSFYGNYLIVTGSFTTYKGVSCKGIVMLDKLGNIVNNIGSQSLGNTYLQLNSGTNNMDFVLGSTYSNSINSNNTNGLDINTVGKLNLIVNSNNVLSIGTTGSITIGITPSVGSTTNQILVRDTSGNVKYVNGASYSLSGSNILKEAGTFSQSVVAVTTVTVTLTNSQPDTNYIVNFTPSSLLAIGGYVSSQSTGSFDITYASAVTGTVSGFYTIYHN